jgi:hypothetical protein
LFGGETIAVHDYNKPIYELAQVLKSEDHFRKSAVILQYVIAANVWLHLPLQMPAPICLTMPFKINEF